MHGSNENQESIEAAALGKDAPARGDSVCRAARAGNYRAEPYFLLRPALGNLTGKNTYEN